MARGYGAVGPGVWPYRGQKSAQGSARRAAQKSPVCKSAKSAACSVGGVVLRAASDQSLLAAFRHFEKSAAARFGLSQADALALWQEVVAAFRADDFTDLRPVARVASGRRVFAWRMVDGRAAFIVLDCAKGLPVTVLSAGMGITRPCGARMDLEVPHDWA